MSADLFNNYESAVNDLVKGISHILENVLPNQSGDERRNELRTLTSDLSEAQELTEQMEMELLALQGPTRSKAAPRMRQIKEQLEKLKGEARMAEQGLGNYENNRRALLGPRDSAAEEAAIEGDQRARLLSGNERLAQGGERLQASHRLALETEAVGAGILNDLRSQREQIINTRDTLMQADGHIDRSQRTLRTMTRRLMTNKMITTGLIVIGVSLVVLILYVKLSR